MAAQAFTRANPCTVINSAMRALCPGGLTPPAAEAAAGSELADVPAAASAVFGPQALASSGAVTVRQTSAGPTLTLVGNRATQPCRCAEATSRAQDLICRPVIADRPAKRPEPYWTDARPAP